jgi:putative mRNA 3-end processing factor
MPAYREAGVALPPTRPVSALTKGEALAGRLVIAPPSAHRSVWMKRFKLPQTAFVSGWMAVRGARRRRGYERGFVMSDHADWPGLVHTVKQSGARQVYVTHGNSDGLARYLREVEGIAAEPLDGRFLAERSQEEQGHQEAEPAPEAAEP